MAYVPITDKLQTTIKNRIRAMRDAEIRAELPHVDDHINVDGSAIYHELMWKEHLHLMPTLPAAWLAQCTGFYLDFEDGPDVRFDGQSAYMVPGTDRWSSTRVRVTAQRFEQLPDSPAKQAVLAKLEEMQARQALTDKWDAVETSIERLLNECKSLNQAVKLVPNLRLYLHKEHIARLDAKREPTEKSEAPTISLEATEAITAAAMAAKLSGAFA